MKWTSFKAVAFPDEFAEQEKTRSLAWRLNRWFGLRFAYILYHLHLSANLVSVLRLLMAAAGFYLMAAAIEGNRYLAVVGVFLIALQINLDYADGPIARARGSSPQFGERFDGLANAATRSVTIIFAGFLSLNPLFLIVSAFTAFVMVTFLPECRSESGGGELPPWAIAVYRPVLSVFFMAFVLPAVFGLLIVFDLPTMVLARVLVLAYATLAVVWLAFLLRHAREN